MNRTRTSKNVKRLLVWLLLLTMVFGLLPMAAFADETVVEPVVSEEPVQEPEPSSESTEAPSEPTQKPTQEPEPEQPGNAVVTIEGDEELEEAAITNNTVELKNEWLKPSSSGRYNGEFMKIFFLDCGRKYFSVDNIKKLIDNASAAGFNYIQLAVGNDGLRFLLDDMSLTVNGTTYSSQQVSDAIHAGNNSYHYFDVDALTQSEMDTIIAYAKEKKMGVIPCVNTPGHMDAILSAASSLTGKTCSYSGSVRTIDVTNATAVEFTQALLQKYISYFKGQGCKFFNMGADEYANDKFTGGAMGFGNLQSEGNYSYYVQYVNQVAAYIKKAGMTPMAFNDGIYFANNTSSGDFDTDILICYWSSGWSSYSPMPASSLREKEFSLVNTHGDYYWVLGKSDAQCSPAKAAGFDETVFPGSTISDPSGAMFCIWCDYPGADTAEYVVSNTANTIAAFGKTLPNPPTTGGGESGGGSTGGETQEPNVTVNLTVGDTKTETQKNVNSENSVGDYDTSIVKINAKYNQVDGETKRTLGSIVSFTDTGAYEGVITDENGNYMVITDGGSINNTKDINEATVFTVNVSNVRTSYSTCTIKGGAYYLNISYSSYNRQYTLSTTKDSANFYYYNDYGFYNSRTITYNNGNWTITSGYGNARLYSFTVSTINPVDETTITFEGIKPGTTTCKIGDTLYEIIVDYKQETVNAVVGGTKTVEGVSGELDPTELNTDVATVTLAGNSLAITGVGEGTTSVIVGNTKYTIVVTKEDLTKVTPLELEYWITNSTLTTNNETSLTVNASDAGVATRNGVEISTIVPKTMSKDGRTQEYWQGKLLDVEKTNSSTSGTELQTTKSGDDETLNGSTFTKVRYWEGAWWVYTTEWVKVDRTQVTVNYTGDNSASETYSGDKNQLVVYYMEVVDISNDKGESELHINAADWGTKGDGTGSWGYPPESYRCSVSVQVVYEEGTTNPVDTSPDSLMSKTIVYGYWSGGRGLGTMIFNGQQNYEIYKVTAETGDMTSTPGTGNTVTVTNFTWDKNEETVWEGDAQTSVSIGNPARSPSYEEPYDNLAWNTSDYNKNNAILIRVYVKAKATADSLTAHYINDNDNSEFYYMNYNVKSGTVFNENFALVDGKLVYNTVSNYNGVTLTVESDLTKMSQIGAQYRYGNFELVRVSRSDDGKDVYLYYKFTTSRTFVVDFGIPLKIEPKDFNAALGAAKDRLTSVEVPTSSTYADIKSDAAFNVIYSLKKTLDSRDSFSVKYYGINIETTEIGKAEYFVEVIPASSVYYEDSNRIVTTVSGKGAAENAKWTTVTDGSKLDEQDVYQALEVLGNKENVYGFDAAYKTSTKFSMGSAQMVTVASSMVSKWDANNDAWPTATFTFKGTGFDIISLTNNQSGAIIVTVSKNGNAVKNLLVDNYYGYNKNENGEWVVNNNAANCLYQIPVIQVRDLDYGEYTAEVKVFYNDAFNQTADSSYSFWFDGFRVYDPMGKNNSIYTKDDEGYPQYIKLRDEIAKASATATVKTTLLFIDGVADARIAEYKNYGPNNEVYLAKDQAISFKLADNANIAKIQIGAKSPNAKETTVAKMQLGSSTTTEIATATEMYYDITSAANNGQLVTITNTGDAVLSLTNIKITYSKQSTTGLAALAESDEQAAVAAVRALYAAPVVEPVEPFKPDHFEAKWSSNVRKGSRAVLTVKASTDVDAIVVNGVTVTQFKTRTERIGYGWNAKRVTYREFSYMMTANEVGTINIPVVAVSNDLGSSAAYDSTLTVKPSSPIRDWIGGIFGRWF